MAWRVLQSGAMLDTVIGKRENGAEVTSMSIYRSGQVIEGNLTAEFVARWVAGEDHARSLVEYGETETVYNEVTEQNEQVFTATGGPSTSSVVDEGQAERAEEAEVEAASLRTQVAELKAELETAESEADQASTASADRVQALEAQNEELQKKLDEAEEVAAGALSYSDLSPEALEAEVAAKGIEVSGTGANGNVLKADRVKALEAARAS